MRILPSFFILILLLVGAATLIFNYYSRVNPSEHVAETQKQSVRGVGADSVQVKTVIDGDTLTLTSGEKVRLIGVNAPEEKQPYYEESRKLLESLTSGKDIDLESDVTTTDQYGRLLSYLYSGNTLINQELIRQGLAVVETVPPNVTHAEDFIKAQQEARENCLGIWEGLCKQTGTSCIQISSINAVPKGENANNKNNEWIEFMNTCLENKNLSGYLLKDSSASNSYTFKDIVVRPKQKVKLHSGCNNDSLTDIYWQCPERGSMIWNNTGDHAFLYDNEGKLVSEMAY